MFTWEKSLERGMPFNNKRGVLESTGKETGLLGYHLDIYNRHILFCHTLLRVFLAARGHRNPFVNGF